MEPWLDDLADDLQSLSFTSSTTTTTTAEINRSASSGSEATLTASSFSSAHQASIGSKPHAPSSDPCWSAIHRIRSENPTRQVTLSDLRFSQRLGSGDIGSVYLAELKCAGGKGCVFAAKVMDKKELMSRSKEGRARTEREILELLDHPFLPTLYASIDSPRWLCLLTEFCPGGDLHVLRQRQPFKRFEELAVRFASLSVIIVAFLYFFKINIFYVSLWV